MRLLHSADWHLGSPMGGDLALRQALEQVPFQVAQAVRQHDCQMLLLSGDLLDRQCGREHLSLLRLALEEAQVPVFISPGNHDPISSDSPWVAERWPGNVHIFTSARVQSVAVPELDCRVYGAAFHGPESAPLLDRFCAQGVERYCVGVFHGDAVMGNSVYNPVSAAQIADSALDYLALGHIHKWGAVRSGDTLCGWPGCPMGRGFDELGEKGVLLVTLEDGCRAEFLPLNTPRFYELQARTDGDPEAALRQVLPAMGNPHHYRVTLTGEASDVRVEGLKEKFSQFPNLQLRDTTVEPPELWRSMGEDTLEGVYFQLLHDAMEGQDEDTCRRVCLAAKISRQLLLGREVKLP